MHVLKIGSSYGVGAQSLTSATNSICVSTTCLGILKNPVVHLRSSSSTIEISIADCFYAYCINAGMIQGSPDFVATRAPVVREAPTFVLVLDIPLYVRYVHVSLNEQEDDSAFGTYAGAGGKRLVYRERTPAGNYRIVERTVDEAMSREEMLDMRATKKADRHCN